MKIYGRHSLNEEYKDLRSARGSKFRVSSEFKIGQMYLCRRSSTKTYLLHELLFLYLFITILYLYLYFYIFVLFIYFLHV